jgi:hypothetical protein
VDQISGTETADGATPAPQENPPAGAAPAAESLGFRSRGSARRRARFLRKARELGYRDLGGLVFNLHRYGQRNDALVLAKLTTLGRIDTELRALEDALSERRPVTVLREAGITACPRCAAIHSSEDSFCPNCGFSIRGHADLPIAAPAPTSTQTPIAAGVPPSTPPTPPTPASPVPSAAPPAPAATQAPAPARAAPARPAGPAQPSPAAGRSPAPPSTTGSPPPAGPATAAPRLPVEDGPTEILGPPPPGS